MSNPKTFETNIMYPISYCFQQYNLINDVECLVEIKKYTLILSPFQVILLSLYVSQYSKPCQLTIFSTPNQIKNQPMHSIPSNL